MALAAGTILVIARTCVVAKLCVLLSVFEPSYSAGECIERALLKNVCCKQSMDLMQYIRFQGNT